MRVLLALSVMVSTGQAATVALVTLPSRSAQDPAWQKSVERVAQRVADRLRARLVLPGPLRGDARLSRGQSLFVQGRLDEAAAVLDQALDEGARSLQSI